MVPGLLLALPTMAAPDFNRDIRPILAQNCVACHGPDEHERKGGVRLDSFDGAVTAGKSGKLPLVPGKRAASEIWVRLQSTDSDEVMPPPASGHELKPAQVALLGAWIDGGGAYDTHWAFKKPVRAEVPAGIAGPAIVDHFITQKLTAEGLTLSPAADPDVLCRRLFLDLTGLPPRLDEVTKFSAEFSKDPDAAVSQQIDALMASPHFGERWARMWLDLARYADSRGYGSDPLRLNIWRYRDWVIEAFNRNLPYDRFTTEQLAGDLLPDPTPDQLLATAFHRNTLTNTLGGTIDEEFRVQAVKDRTETTAQAWMGLTMRCAQCHTHKFDPITNDEYYGFYAIFNQTADNDQPDEFPLAPTPTREQQQQIDGLKNRIATLRKDMDRPTDAFLAKQADWERQMRESKLWHPISVASAKAAADVSVQTQADGTLFVGGKIPATLSTVLEAPAGLQGVTAVRIEALPDDRLPSRGPGYGGGNFVLSEVKLFERPQGQAPVAGRFVRVELPGNDRILHLAEIQAVSGGKNVAQAGKATASSIDYDGLPEKLIDGNTDGEFEKGSVQHTRSEPNPWVEIDLGSAVPLESVSLWNRKGGGLAGRADGLVLKVLDAERKTVFSQSMAKAPDKSATVAVDGRRELKIRSATATFEQGGFPAKAAIDGAVGPESGWAIGGRPGTPQSLVLELAEPLCLNYGCWLTLELAQNYPQHALGRFRVSVTTTPAPIRALPESLSPVLAKAAESRSPAEIEALRSFYGSLDPAKDAVARQVADLEKELASIKPAETPVMRELAAGKRRATKTMVKGNYLVPGKAAAPNVPAAFHGPAEKNARGEVDRLTLAKWIMSPDNPLTARVAVNRFWSQIFGRGLVFTEEDFGTQGTFPSHPELLDWLACDFRDGGWDMKALLKRLLLSKVYRQSSSASDVALAKDPQNVLLSRGPRFRLDAEFVRDQALSLSGLLSEKMFGPSVYPPQPDGLWRAAFNGERSYPTSTGEDRYRRGIYVFVRRTVPYPSMSTFDAPNRELCTLRRIRTNTPLQAFVTLNDPAYVEMAQAFARRLTREGGATPESQIRHGLRLCLLREPQAEKVTTLVELYGRELAHYRENVAEAKKFARDPLNPLPDDKADWPHLASMTVVTNVLLNLDAVLTKR